MDQEEPELHDGQRPSCEVLTTPTKPESTHFMTKEDDYNQKRLRKSRYLLNFRSWGPEASWCFVALLLLVLLALALKQFDGKAPPNWPLGLTLNTLIAFLSTICRSIMVLPVTEGLLQLKWNWFAGKGRPLRDIHLFDKASRSPWASIQLITRLRGRFIPIGILASLVLVASLATSFITQSTISYSTRTVVAHNKSAESLASLEFPTGLHPEQRIDSYFAPDGILRAAERSLFYRVDANESWSALKPHCPTANCRWPIFSSLAICASMGNVTNYLTTDESDPGFMTLPRGLGRINGGLNITSPAYTTDREPQINLNATEPFYKWENSDITLLSLARAFFLYVIPAYEPDAAQAEAVEVVWHYCVHTYNISVTDNVANTALLESEAKIHQYNDESVTFVLLDKSGQRKFSVLRYGVMNGLQRRIPTTFVGDMLSFSESPNLVNVNEFTYQIGNNLASGVLGYHMTEQPTERRRQIMWNNLRNITETMALAMTDFMRVNQVNGTVKGDALESEIFITVRWSWLSFLAAQIGLTIVFVLAVAALTFSLEVPVIKGSNVAELFAIRKSDMETTTPATVGGKQAGIDQKIDKQTLGILVREYDTWHLEIHSKE